MTTEQSADVRTGTDVVLEARGVTKHFPVRRTAGDLVARRHRTVHAVDDVTLELRRGTVTALVGESGSGKSTVARLLAQLYPLTAGEIRMGGTAVKAGRGRSFRTYVKQVQLIFQDPFASLNPYHSIRYAIQRPLQLDDVVPKDRLDDEVRRLLNRVRLDPDTVIDRRPHELSGGQRQRVAIARALASRPRLLVADEPVSMLDVSIRLGVLNLLADLQREEGLGVLYITHDLATARHFSDEILVLNQGRVVERGPADDVILRPQNPYTQELRAASPDPDTYFAHAAGILGGDR